ncbi:hypothetical protein [Mesorhizobium sp.]|uniref:hypothetical protein n=1 Tax=Mesorhizobium sp. TaxID=1871066 RepID=UPI000FE49A21|nr:hypothetical protein [Mesorhizobium sp.]RWP49507.1 MAG: hypothetical protein EOR05_10010 [Mesorhizobium sp.]
MHVQSILLRFLQQLDAAIALGKTVRSYLPYVLGAALGLLAAFILSAIFGVGGTAQLLLFGLLPAIGGATCERIVSRN